MILTTFVSAFVSAARAFLAFLRHPRWSVPLGLGSGEGRSLWAGASALYLAVLVLVLGPLLHVWQKLMSLPAPEAFGEVSPMLLVPVVVLVAPLGEEAIFRGWLGGRPRGLALLGALVVLAGALWTMRDGAAHPLSLLVALLALLGGAGGWWALRRRAVPGWFVTAFPGLFAVQAAVFALFHLTNYPRPGGWAALALVPMVLPQLWAGLVFGFIRVRVGLPAAIAAHGLGNLAAVALARFLG